MVLANASPSSSDACALSKFDYSDASGLLRGLAGQLNFETGDACDLIVRITDNGGAVSEDQLLHVSVLDVNDPPRLGTLDRILQ